LGSLALYLKITYNIYTIHKLIFCIDAV